MAAYWTRGDQLPARIHWFWFYGLLAHVVVLGLWAWAWALWWQGYFGRGFPETIRALNPGTSPAPVLRTHSPPMNPVGTRSTASPSFPDKSGTQWNASLPPGRGGAWTQAARLLLWIVPVGLAIVAEAAQKFLPGHVPDWIGLAYNLVGVTLGLWLYRQRIQPQKSTARRGRNQTG